MQNNPDFVMSIIQIMYDSGEINEATYKKIIEKLRREKVKDERSK